MNTSVKNFQIVPFPGFYGSVYDMGETLYQLEYDETSDLGLSVDDIMEDRDYTFDYKGYEKAIAEEWVIGMQALLKRVFNYDINLHNEVIDSPTYYNYRNDEIFCEVSMKHMKWFINHKVLPLMRKHKVKLAELIYDNHTTYDGFISFMENDFDYWYSYLANSKNYLDRKFHLYFTYTLTYLVYIVEFNCDEGDMFSYFYYDSNVCSWEYATFTKEWIEKRDEILRTA